MSVSSQQVLSDSRARAMNWGMGRFTLGALFPLFAASPMVGPTAALWTMLRRGQLGHRFERKRRIGPYHADFACPALKLVVEVDSPARAQRMGREATAKRLAFFHREGWSVVRYWAHEVLEAPEDVLWAIDYECASRRRATPRRARLRRRSVGRGAPRGGHSVAAQAPAGQGPAAQGLTRRSVAC